MITMHEFRQLINDGRLFSVTFTKLDGSTRKMTARLGVKPRNPGKQKNMGLKYNPVVGSHIVVYEMKNGYRTINIENVKLLRANGVTYRF